MNLAILGGGIAGLSSAIALAQLGLRVEVYERRMAVHNLGAGVVCWPNATFVLSQLGILDEIANVSGKPSAMQRISAHGQPLGQLDIERLNLAMGYPSLSVLRADLIRILFRRTQQLGVPVHFGKCAEAIRTTARQPACQVTFTDGTTVTADIVLGGEGRMKSAARKFVTGDSTPVFQKFVNWIGVYESDLPLFADMLIQDYWGVGSRFGIVPVTDRKAYWAGGIAVNKDVSTPADYRTELHSAFRNWPDPIENVVAQVTNHNTHKLALYDHDPLPKWDRANVLLIGDAAHAALPTSGQGAAQALEDAWTLAQLFESNPSDWKTIMNLFAAKRLPKTNGITMGARSLARSLFDTDPESCAQRDANALSTDYDRLTEGMAKGWSAGLPMKLSR